MNKFRIDKKEHSEFQKYALVYSLKYQNAVKDLSYEGKGNKLGEKVWALLSKPLLEQRPDLYMPYFREAKELYYYLNSDSEVASYNSLSDHARKASSPDERRAALTEMLKFREAKDRVDKVKNQLYDIMIVLHEIFAIPPQEISGLCKSIASDLGMDTLVSYYNSSFTKKRAHGFNDFSDLLEAKNIVETQRNSSISAKEKCYLYMNLSYAYEVFDYKKSLEYILIAEKFGDFCKDEIIEKKAAYYLGIFDKVNFFEFFKQIKDKQKALDLVIRFKKLFPNDTPPKLTVKDIQGTKILPGNAEVRDIISSVDTRHSDKAKDDFYKLMKTQSSIRSQKFLASILITTKNSDYAVKFLESVNEEFPFLREDSIFNPNLLIAEMQIFTESKKFDQAIEKLREIDYRLRPYGENTCSIDPYLNSVKFSLVYSLLINLEPDKAESILQFFPINYKEELIVLIPKIKEWISSKDKPVITYKEEEGTVLDEEDFQAKLQLETSAVKKEVNITLPSNIKDFSEQVSFGSIPLESLSGKLAHAYFTYKKAIIDSTLISENATEIQWKTERKVYSYPSFSTTKVVKLNSLVNHYISIDPELDLGENEQAAAMRVLEMARIARKKDQPGVKLLEGKLYELKILGELGDLRLIANTIYDYVGNKLILFNKKANHSTLKTVMKSTKTLNVQFLDEDQVGSSKAMEVVDCGQNFYSKAIEEEGSMLLLGETILDSTDF